MVAVAPCSVVQIARSDLLVQRDFTTTGFKAILRSWLENLHRLYPPPTNWMSMLHPRGLEVVLLVPQLLLPLLQLMHPSLLLQPRGLEVVLLVPRLLLLLLLLQLMHPSLLLNPRGLEVVLLVLLLLPVPPLQQQKQRR